MIQKFLGVPLRPRACGARPQGTGCCGVRFASVLHCVSHRSLRSRPSHPSPMFSRE
ncbi:MAG: hypothetical protein RMJ53_01420 [Chitinophagales bacterium]|nr:hypothetical protein [Chitinophagales bacterium]